jgi:hypothetical protein
MSRREGKQHTTTTTTSALLSEGRRKQASHERQIHRDTVTDVEFLDSLDDPSFEAELLMKNGYSSDSFENMRAFGPKKDSDAVLKEIKKVRTLQQEISRSHLRVEMELNGFVMERSSEVTKAEKQSETFCEDFRKEFAKKKTEMEDVSKKLSELATSVERVNSLIN